ncbi:MAG TPA: ferritin-like domain-containing protein [Sandaracinaceae bacterium LLY-WYZ-13_1]|nr:ferritin-like domain-containing protein [Sandaracinaceae bacterium LLY-WYZ-13_1]
MKLPRLERLAARVVAAAMPTLAASTLLDAGCATSRHATYVVPMTGDSCREACARATGRGSGSWRATAIDDCTRGTLVSSAPPDAQSAGEDTVAGARGPDRPVAVCRMVERYTGGVGRRPPGLRPAELADGDPRARWLVEAARLEAASVIAFRRLAHELRAHRAPAVLVGGAREAARDEVRHARTMARWRDRLGGSSAPVEVAPAAPRSLRALAEDNAVEGCVGETWGALVIAVQARAAADPALRADLRRIADDELAHAAWSVALHRWTMPRLSRAERDAIEARAHAAIDDLRPLAATDASRWLGLPEPAAHARMLEVARPALRSALAS